MRWIGTKNSVKLSLRTRSTGPTVGRLPAGFLGLVSNSPGVNSGPAVTTGARAATIGGVAPTLH
jgi:hypothetical protein